MLHYISKRARVKNHALGKIFFSTNSPPIMFRSTSFIKPIQKHKLNRTKRTLNESKPFQVLEWALDNREHEWTSRSISYDELKILTKMTASDILSLESDIQRSSTCLQPLEKCTVIVINHIKTVIMHDRLLLFDTKRPSSISFASTFKEEFTGTHILQTTDFAFEIKAMDTILSYVIDRMQWKVDCFVPVVNNIIEEIDANSLTSSIPQETLLRLYPLISSLEVFEQSSQAIVSSVTAILSNEQDMLMMLLSERRLLGKLPPLEHHDPVELLFENYHRQFRDIVMQAVSLRRGLQSASEAMNVSLGAYRNKLLTINLNLSMGMFSIGMGTFVAGLFGMNLKHGFEEFDHLFEVVSMMSVGAVYAAYILSNRLILKRGEMERIVLLRQGQKIMHKLDDVQDYILEKIDEIEKQERRGFNLAEFTQLLSSVNHATLESKEIEIIFRLYDRQNDGYLSKEDVKRFLCDQHSLTKA